MLLLALDKTNKNKKNKITPFLFFIMWIGPKGIRKGCFLLFYFSFAKNGPFFPFTSN
jgi:hypothetical protein